MVLLPLGCLVIANRTLRALLCERHQPRRRGDHAASANRAPAPRPVLTEQERTAGTPEQAEALLAATRDGDIERALALVEAGADPDTAPAADDRDQRPVLMLAALLPDTRLLRALIAKGADVNRASGGITPLLAATRDSWHGRAEAVLTLLANGASPLVADTDGNTALHGAVLQRRARRGGDAAGCGGADQRVEQGRHRSAGHGVPRRELAAGEVPAGAWRQAGAGRRRTGPGRRRGNRRRRRRRNQAAAQASRPGQRASMHATACVASAAAEGHEQIARALCAAGADVKLADKHGSTALMEAARAGAGGIVQLLAEAQPDVRARDQHGRDALTLACQSPHAHARDRARAAGPRRRTEDARQ